MEMFFRLCLTMTVLIGINFFVIFLWTVILKNKTKNWFDIYIGSVLLSTVAMWFLYMMVSIWI